jgi:hypothetical protein
MPFPVVTQALPALERTSIINPDVPRPLRRDTERHKPNYEIGTLKTHRQRLFPTARDLEI